MTGDRLIGATVNSTGSLIMRAEKVGADTLLSQIVRMVSEAQRSRAPIQKLADVVAGYFVPAVVAVAVIAFVRLEFMGAGTAAGACHRECCCGSHHRLSLRAGSGDTDVDYGGHRQRRDHWGY